MEPRGAASLLSQASYSFCISVQNRANRVDAAPVREASSPGGASDTFAGFSRKSPSGS
jgi:hypothetical protein